MSEDELLEAVGEGWWWPSNSKKAHYVVEGRSLCRKWLAIGSPPLEQGNDDSVDNCAECRRRKIARDSKGGKTK